MLNRQTLSTQERLKSRKIFEKLFSNNKSVTIAPVKAIWIEADLNTIYPAQVGFIVSSKILKNAVDRNRIKRIVREIYRKNKINLYEKLFFEKKQIALAFIYNSKKIDSYHNIEEKILLILERIINSNTFGDVI